MKFAKIVANPATDPTWPPNGHYPNFFASWKLLFASVVLSVPTAAADRTHKKSRATGRWERMKAIFFCCSRNERRGERYIANILCCRQALSATIFSGWDGGRAFIPTRSIHDLKDKVQSCIPFKSQSCSLQAYVTWFAVSNFFVPFAVLLFCYRCKYSSHFQGLLKAASSEEQ